MNLEQQIMNLRTKLNDHKMAMNRNTCEVARRNDLKELELGLITKEEYFKRINNRRSFSEKACNGLFGTTPEYIDENPKIKKLK